MKIKFGSLVVDGRGKIGGHVASKNRSGAYLRTKVTPVNPRSTSQSIVRGRLGNISQGWRSLTDAQRAAWIAAVGEWKTTNVFGDVKLPSGSILHSKLNLNLAKVSAAAISSPLPPAIMTLVRPNVLASAAGTPSLTLTFSAAFPAGYKAYVSATPCISSGKSYVANMFRSISTLATLATPPANLLADWVAKFGGNPVVGSKIAVKLQFVNTTTGQVSPEYVVSCIVAA